jgi:hypothetical protein
VCGLNLGGFFLVFFSGRLFLSQLVGLGFHCWRMAFCDFVNIRKGYRCGFTTPRRYFILPVSKVSLSFVFLIFLFLAWSGRKGEMGEGII